MSHHVPQPRYSPEHRQQSKDLSRPLFTLDIYWPSDRRTTATGVLSDDEIRDQIKRLERVMEVPNDLP